MVGVPGRSKGCQTCRKRKVKCDEKRPLCGRCPKAGYQCQGYERPLEFRIMIATTQLKSTEPVNPVEQSVPSSLSLVAFKDVLEFSYLLNNFVWQTYGWPWLEMSAAGRLGKLSLDACQCFAQIIYGQHHHLKDIEFQGQMLYGKTVRTLSQALDDISNPTAEELIVPILLLLMHASTVGDRQEASFHVMGLNKAIQGCKPAQFAKMPLRSVFESARSTLFTVSLATKTRSFLERSAWKIQPWIGLRLPLKSPQNELIDILIDLPGHLQDLSDIKRGIASEAKLVTLIYHLRSDLAALYEWRWRWQRVNPNAAWEIEPAYLPPRNVVDNCRPFHKILWFQTFTEATEIQLYNTVLLCTLGLLWQFVPQNDMEPTLPSDGPLRMPNQYSSLQEPAEEICRAFEYQILNAPHYRESALFWLLPLGIAHKVLEGDIWYESWIQSLLDASQSLRGYGSGTREFAFGHYDFLEPVLRRYGSNISV